VLFTGNYEHTIDAKHRLAIPADIRNQWIAEECGAAWYATPWVGSVIRLYTEADFKARAREHMLGLTPDADHAELLSTLFGLSARLEPDSAGRIRLSDDMLELVDLDSEIVLVGCGEWLEVQDRAAWRASRKDRLKQIPALMQRLDTKHHDAGATQR
jgi:MraZ protein